jgi:hypothetical protein
MKIQKQLLQLLNFKNAFFVNISFLFAIFLSLAASEATKGENNLISFQAIMFTCGFFIVADLHFCKSAILY